MSLDAFKAKFNGRPKPLSPSVALAKVTPVTAPELVGPPAPWDSYLLWCSLMNENPRLDPFRFKHLLPEDRDRVLVRVRSLVLSTEDAREVALREQAHAREVAESEAALAALQEQLDRAALSDRLGAW